LRLHEPGNELHIVPEVSIPGGSVDYFLVSVKEKVVADFVGIELQTLDTTGTVWPERQRFLNSRGLMVAQEDVLTKKGFGMNWKMTAKTILIQLHHKTQTFENLNKHLVLVIQDKLLEYFKKEFQFDHLTEAQLSDSMHFHSYRLSQQGQKHSILELDESLSTDSEGIAKCLGLQAEANVDIKRLEKNLESKLSDETLFLPG